LILNELKNQKKKKNNRELLSLKLTRNKNIMEDYKTSCEILENEKKQEKVNTKNSKRFNGSINEVLTEEELMAYAMMLSMDQKEQVICSNNNNKIDEELKSDLYQYESDQEKIPKDYVDEQEKKDFLYASELAKQDMIIEKINNETNDFDDHFNNNFSEENEDNGISAEQYFKEERIKQEQRNKRIINTCNKNNNSENELITDSINEYSNDIYDTSETSSNIISKNKYMQKDTLLKSKGGKKGKNKKNKGKKKANFIPLEEWENNNDDKNFIITSNTSNNRNYNEMNEEEYLNYVLQLSLHDK